MSDLEAWRLCGRPPADGLDTRFALNVARLRGWTRKRVAADERLFDGRVALLPLPDHAPLPVGWRRGNPHEANFREAEEILSSLWPEVAEQFGELVSVAYAVDLESPWRQGYSSDHWITGPFTMAVTGLDAYGTAEGLVHEMAHLKLIYLGVPREGASELLLNPPTELHPSPVRGCDRPLTAILHALYSWMHMLELQLRMLPTRRQQALQRLARNVAWVAEMDQLVARKARWSRSGEAFHAGARTWIDELLRAGRSSLQHAAPT